MNSEGLELKFWDSIKNSTDPEEFRAYLERFPNGTFSALAKRRIQALRSPVGRPDVSNPGSARPSNTTQAVDPVVKAKFFTFTLHGCRASGSTVLCNLSITNEESMERQLIFYYQGDDLRTRVFDDQGNEGRFTDNRIGGRPSSDFDKIVPGITIKASATFDGISEQASSLKLLSLLFATSANGVQRSFKVEFRDVPLTR